MKTAKKLAAAYPGQFRDIYTKAAEDLRAPYWDWALEPQVLQATVSNTIQINVATATGIQKAGIANPLYTYNFPQPARQGRYGAFDQKNDRTYRCTSPKSYPSSANQNLASRNYKGALVSCIPLFLQATEHLSKAWKYFMLNGRFVFSRSMMRSRELVIFPTLLRRLVVVVALKHFTIQYTGMPDVVASSSMPNILPSSPCCKHFIIFSASLLQL